MRKLLKIGLGIAAGLVALLVLLVAAFALFFDPNDFRSQITEAVRKSTGRELTLGDVKLSVWPTLGTQIKEVTLGNAPGFGSAPLAQVAQADVGLALVPLLLQRELKISKVTLNGLRMNLATSADGKHNWDGILSAPPQAAGGKPAEPTTGGPGVKFVDIGGVTIKDAALSYEDKRTKQTTALSGLNLSTGSIRPGQPFDLKLAFATRLSKPAATADVALAARVSYDANQQTLQTEQLGLKVKAALADLNADMDLSFGLSAQLATPSARAEKIRLTLDATGKALPGGKQTLRFTGDAAYDGAQGTLKLTSGELSAAGLNASFSLDGTGLASGKPRFAGPLAVKPFNPRELLKTLGKTVPTTDPEVLKQLGLNGRIDATPQSLRINSLVMQLDQSNFTGSLGLASFATQALEFALKLDVIDADRYLPPPNTASAGQTSAAPQDKAAVNATEVPLNLLNSVAANGTLDIGQLKLAKLRLSNVQLRLAARPGAEQQISLAGQLYGGSLASQTRITPGAQPRVAQTLKLTAISAGPLLKDLTGKESMTGRGNVTLDINSSGKTVGALKQALAGDVSLSFANGAVKGFNLGQLLRKGQALLKGQQLKETEPQQTDFTELSTSAKITGGVLQSDALNAKSPLFRVDGAGKADLFNETIDYTAKPTVVNSATGQGGKDLQDLAGLVIPVRITGTFSEPKYALDLKAALAQKATQGLRDKVSDKLTNKLGGGSADSKGKVGDKLKSLFGNKK